MPEQSSMHGYLNWAKQRLDEMDATLSSLEARTSQAKADSKAKADHLIADLKNQRDEFQAKIAAQTNKVRLESHWHDFEAHVKTYFETAGKQIEQQHATFQDVANSQANAWRDAADKLNIEAAKLAAARRADVDAAIKQLNADAVEANARLQKLKQAGTDSWSTLSAALTESRKAFDRANQEAWEAIKRAASLKT